RFFWWSWWLPSSEQSEQLERDDQRQREADRQHDGRRRAPGSLVDADVEVHQQVAQAGAEVMQVSPDQPEQHEPCEPVRDDRAVVLETQLGDETLLEEVEHERQADQEHQRAA